MQDVDSVIPSVSRDVHGGPDPGGASTPLRRARHNRLGMRVLAACVLALCGARAQEAPSRGGAWAVRDAPVRFVLRLTQRPTHESAGYFGAVPDGGSLPQPYPVPRVFTPDGTELAAAVLWQNRDAGFCFVFAAPPDDRDVILYVEPGARLQTWTPDSELTPSPILCAQPGRASLTAAHRLAGLGPVGPEVHVHKKAGIPKAPLCIQGDLEGRPPPTAFYMLAYLEARTAGRYWVAPFTLKGSSEVRINGQTVRPSKRIDKWGGTGDWVQMQAGLQRTELFVAFQGGADYSEGSGVMWLTWAPPDATVDELGGARPADVPFAGTAKWASRVIQPREIVESGETEIASVSARDGGPAACVRLIPEHVFWFENEDPILAYRLEALTAGNPPDTVYRWDFGDRVVAEGPVIRWLFPGRSAQRVTLRAERGTQRSVCAKPFYAYATVPTRIDSPTTRAAFRMACLTMLKAWPPGTDPTAGWGTAMWNTLFRVLAVGEGDALLAHLFTERWDAMKRKLTPERRARLEDLFIVMAGRLDPEGAVQWAERLEQDAAGERAALLALQRAEILLYELANPAAARAIAAPLSRRGGAAGTRAQIRMGDIAFVEGDLKEAVRLYGAAQDTPGGAADWRGDAVREAALSERIAGLIEQGYHDEARAELDAWEISAPLSKVTTDFIVLRARLDLALKRARRARAMLEAYVERMDASSHLPAAVKLLLDSMIALKVSDAELRTWAETLRERLKFHPDAARIDTLLESL
jgi:hypothetical protein